MSLVKKLGNISVRLSQHTNCNPLELASFAAKYCYGTKPPKFGEMLDVENQLFLTGHHTTLEHFYFTFKVNGISVGDITLGMHLYNPFYNSDQRSGRFCADMFSNPDFDGIKKYIGDFWPQTESYSDIEKYFGRNVNIYNANIKKATKLIIGFLKEERLFVSEKFIQKNAHKMAQEQLRVFMPVIFPTGFVYTVDLITLVSMYGAAFSPVMKWVVGRMAQEVLCVFPELKFMFGDEAGAYASPLKLNHYSQGTANALYKPVFNLVGEIPDGIIAVPRPKETHPIDSLHFHPKFMNNNVLNIDSLVEVSLATLGQDQRHRLIRRSLPILTGNFYIPPVVRELGLEDEMRNTMYEWFNLWEKLPDEKLWYLLAPYGAMVSYNKSGSVNAIAHEQAKRTCFGAQEEIYHLSTSERKIIEIKKPKSDLLELFNPPCRNTGKCAECSRYCGRNMKAEDYFPERKV